MTYSGALNSDCNLFHLFACHLIAAQLTLLEIRAITACTAVLYFEVYSRKHAICRSKKVTATMCLLSRTVACSLAVRRIFNAQHVEHDALHIICITLPVLASLVTRGYVRPVTLAAILFGQSPKFSERKCLSFSCRCIFSVAAAK